MLKYEVVVKDYNMKIDNVGDVAVDSKDNVYFTPRGQMTPIIVLDRNGKLVKTIGTGMNVKNAHGVCLDAEDNIYLVDCGRHVIHKFNQDGELLFTLGSLDKPALESGAINGDYKTVVRAAPPFYMPSKAATTKLGELFVADGYGNCCVHHFSKSGKLIKSWGGAGFGPGEFHLPHGIAIDHATNDVYVTDRENNRIQIFDYDGKVKSIWNNFFRPTDVCFFEDYIYVSEAGHQLFTDNVYHDPRYSRQFAQVRIFDKDRNQVAQIGTPNGGEPGSFLSAHGLCVDSYGDLYVCETTNFTRRAEFIAWPGGVGMPTRMNPSLQKFEKIKF
jgi:DNA-binding beta-propeller fold protein YncE